MGRRQWKSQHHRCLSRGDAHAKPLLIEAPRDATTAAVAANDTSGETPLAAGRRSCGVSQPLRQNPLQCRRFALCAISSHRTATP
jgi:hypothetical protein